jgi:hypothetical protein
LHHTNSRRSAAGENCVIFFIKERLTHIVYSNWIVAIGAGSLSAGWSKFADLSNWWLYGVFAFCSVLSVYNLQRLFKVTHYSRTPWLLWVERNRKALLALIFSSTLGAAISFYFLYHFSWTVLGYMALAGGISFFYVARIRRGSNLRDLPYLKIHLIALTWVLVLFLFPLLNEGHTYRISAALLAHYAYVLAITIPFDIRDLKYDEPRQRTIPQMLGVKGAKILGVLLLMLFTLGLGAAFPELILNPLLYLAVGVQIMLIFWMTPTRSDVYCAGGIDGAIVLLGLAYYFA